MLARAEIPGADRTRDVGILREVPRLIDQTDIYNVLQLRLLFIGTIGDRSDFISRLDDSFRPQQPDGEVEDRGRVDRPVQDVRQQLYFLYPKVSQPGDFWGNGQSPNLLGTERTGPDLSQESGWHPDDWQRAHFYDPRYMDPRSLMPDMKSLFSDKQVDQLVAFVEERSGKSGLLRYAGQLYAKHVVLANQGFPPPYKGFQGAQKPIVPALPDSKLVPPPGQLEEAPNLAQIDRSYWLSANPLPVTEANLQRADKGHAGRAVDRTPRPWTFDVPAEISPVLAGTTVAITSSRRPSSANCDATFPPPTTQRFRSPADSINSW